MFIVYISLAVFWFCKFAQHSLFCFVVFLIFPNVYGHSFIQQKKIFSYYYSIQHFSSRVRHKQITQLTKSTSQVFLLFAAKYKRR
ncbi:hypothetical protein BX070DRAFT_226137 [Coemansia spiralis]|nr:hypothetical protein BX070DRAFT_226137 [Coemansia spiralis]